MSALATFSTIVLKVLAREIRQVNKMKDTQMEKEGKQSLLEIYMILCIENL